MVIRTATVVKLYLFGQTGLDYICQFHAVGIYSVQQDLSPAGPECGDRGAAAGLAAGLASNGD